MSSKGVIRFGCPPNGVFPNNEQYPVCILKQVFAPGIPNLAGLFEHRFQQNKWPPAWRNGLYNFHHFHSRAHEVLGIYSGWVEVCFGGPGGKTAKASSGDAIIIPAGVSHMNVKQSGDFSTVGAYPHGQTWDMKYGSEDDFYLLKEKINNVQLPEADPVYGTHGPLKEIWQLRMK